MARTYLNAHLIWPDFLYVLKNMSSKNRQVKVCSISKKLPQKILAFFFTFSHLELRSNNFLIHN